MHIKTLFITMVFIAYQAIALEETKDIEVEVESPIHQYSVVLEHSDAIEMTAEEAHAALRLAYDAPNETDILTLLTNQKQSLLASKVGTDLALEAVVRYGTLEVAKELFKDAGVWWRLNKEVLERELNDGHCRFRDVTVSYRNKLFFAALTAAARRSDSTLAIEMTDFMFDQLSLSLHVLPFNNINFFCDVLTIASKHQQREVVDHLLQKWSSINTTIGYFQSVVLRAIYVYPIYTFFSFLFVSLCSHDAMYSITLASEFSIGSSFFASVFAALHNRGISAYCHVWSDRVFINAARCGHFSVLDYLLSIPHELPLPTQRTLIRVYRDLRADAYRVAAIYAVQIEENNARQGVITRLEALIPAHER